MNVTNLYDRFFVSTEEYMTAARLPYFEGSFWCTRAEIMTQEIEKEGNNELQKKVKLLSRRKLKTMSYKTTAGVDVDDVKNILVMEKVIIYILDVLRIQIWIFLLFFGNF